MKTIIKNGTPVHGDNLCLHCGNCTLRRGHRVSQEELFCSLISNGDGVTRIPYAVAECTGFRDKRLERAGTFYSTGWTFVPDYGFIPPDKYRQLQMKGKVE